MEENNNEKISVSGADLLKDVVADEKAAKTAPKAVSYTHLTLPTIA